MAGRPSKYESHVKPKLLLIEAWARDGLTEADIAKNLDVAMSSFSEYKNQYPELVESLKRNKEEADIVVENALYKRALGYDYEETTLEPIYNGDGDPIRNPDGTPMIAVTKIVKKQVAPDTTAQIFWLKNRRPSAWRDKQEVESLNHNMNQDMTQLSPDERRARIDELIRKRGNGTDPT